MTYTLSTQIKKARENAGMTQAELAQKLFIAQNTLGGWETGRHEPKISYLREIAEICDVRLSWLMGEAPRRPIASTASKSFRFLVRESSEMGTGNQ